MTHVTLILKNKKVFQKRKLSCSRLFQLILINRFFHSLNVYKFTNEIHFHPFFDIVIQWYLENEIKIGIHITQINSLKNVGMQGKLIRDKLSIFLIFLIYFNLNICSAKLGDYMNRNGFKTA